LSESDVLLTVAEIAIALAGFATLAAVLMGNKRLQRDSERSSSLFRTLLLYSLLTVGLCFVPFVPQWYGSASHASWYVSSWVLASTVACINLWLSRRNNPGYSQLHWLMLVPWLALSWAPVLVAGSAIAGIGPVAGGYLLGVLLTLGLSAAAFVQLIFDLLSGPATD
jgi:hypothetical protein